MLSELQTGHRVSQNWTPEFPKVRLFLCPCGCQSITALKRPYDWIYNHITTGKKLNTFLRKEGVPLKGQLLNECTISSLPELGCNLWNASQGTVVWNECLTGNSGQSMHTLHSFPTLSESSTNTIFLYWNKMGGVGVRERPGRRPCRGARQMWLLRIQKSLAPRKRT